METSTISEWVARLLEGLGHEVVVADPNYAPIRRLIEAAVSPGTVPAAMSVNPDDREGLASGFTLRDQRGHLGAHGLFDLGQGSGDIAEALNQLGLGAPNRGSQVGGELRGHSRHSHCRSTASQSLRKDHSLVS